MLQNTGRVNLSAGRNVYVSLLTASSNKHYAFISFFKGVSAEKGRPFCTEERLYMSVCMCVCFCVHVRSRKCVCVSAFVPEIVLVGRTVVTAAPVSSFSCACIVISPRLSFPLCNGWVCEFPVSYILIGRLLGCLFVAVLLTIIILNDISTSENGKEKWGRELMFKVRWRCDRTALVFNANAVDVSVFTSASLACIENDGRHVKPSLKIGSGVIETRNMGV